MFDVECWMLPGVLLSIVTPSLRQLDWLKLCARSLADQNVEVDHIIQDAGTGAELDRWARSKTNARLFVEDDTGMYDALNRGFARAHGEIFAWLNCDEQYLPGAFAAVRERFSAEPELDVLLADNIVIDSNGHYRAHRFSLKQTPTECSIRLAVSSCALFFRRRVWRPFDLRWKSAGDWWWFVAMLQAGARVGILRKFVSAFAETGQNIGLLPISAEEQRAIIVARPWWVKATLPFWLARHRFRMWRAGASRVRPFSYQIHMPESSGRVTFEAKKPTSRWRR